MSSTAKESHTATPRRLPRGRGLWMAVQALCLLLTGALALSAAEAPRNDFRFSIIGDRTGGAQPGVYERVWREISLLQPDFVVNAGDSIEGRNDATAEAQWDEVIAMRRRYTDVPLYFTPGNHDIWSSRSEEIYRAKTGFAPFHSFSYQNAHFVVLDNSRTEKLSDEQLNFLEADLAQHATHSPKFIFFHKPYWLLNAMLKDRSARLHQICKRYGVEWVVSGHGHQLTYVPFDGINYLEVGSAGAKLFGENRDEGFDRGWFYHHALVRVKDGRAQVTIRELDGARGKGRIFPLTDWNGIKPTFPPDDPAAPRR